MGILYIVGTPIGNLADMTYRGVDTLRSVDFICAEDTRVTAKLLSFYDIKKPLVSYHEHNARSVEDTIIARILAGENAAVVTDAGMPCISDPGELLVKRCAQEGVEVRAVPGATAAMTALAISGLNTKSFSFRGFLSVNKNQRNSHLAAIRDCPDTLIFYEAPHKLRATLLDLEKFLGDRKISLCRELTKLHEEVIRTTISQAVKLYEQKEPKGEYVLIVEGAAASESGDTLPEAVSQVSELVDKGMRPADACKQLAKLTKFSKGEIYTAYLESRSDGDGDD